VCVYARARIHTHSGQNVGVIRIRLGREVAGRVCGEGGGGLWAGESKRGVSTSVLWTGTLVDKGTKLMDLGLSIPVD
jgi:hypothetical protein